MSYLDDFVAEAEKDGRIGDLNAVVQACEAKTWPSGDAYHRLTVYLTDAGNAKADCNLNPIPTESELASIKAEGNRGKMRGVAQGITMAKQLQEHYGITDPAKITEGMALRVKTVKTKVDAMTGKGGFIRIVAFLPKGGGSTKVDDADGPNF